MFTSRKVFYDDDDENSFHGRGVRETNGRRDCQWKEKKHRDDYRGNIQKLFVFELSKTVIVTV